MSGNELLDKMSLIDPAYIEAAEQKPKRTRLLRYVAAAACLCLIVSMLAFFGYSDKSTDKPALQNKSTAKVTYNYEGQIPTIKSDLVPLSEEEMFGMENLYIFRGIVIRLENVSIDFNGNTAIRCIATIRISKVFKGNLTVNSEIRVLLPCGINIGHNVEDTGVIRRLSVGMEGIFMPIVYDDDSFWEQNGAVLYHKELTPCGLGDGMRWAFLKTDRGLVYMKSAYPGAKGAQGLEDIEEYIKRMLN